MKFEAFIANGKLICSNSDTINRHPGLLLIQVFADNGIYRVTGEINDREISGIKIENAVEALNIAERAAAELPLYKEALQKLKKNLSAEGDGREACDCDHPNYVRNTSTKTGKICLSCGGI
jgi:hypothetical protein